MTGEYISTTTNQGEGGLFNIIKIEAENFDIKTSPKINEEFCRYFARSVDELLEKEQKNILDLSNVKHIDSAGLSAILFLNRLNMINYNQRISIINCLNEIKDHFHTTQIDTVIEVKYKDS